MVVDMFYMVHHLLKNNVVQEMNLMLYHEWNMLAFQEFQVVDMSIIYFELYNVHYTILQFVNVDGNQDREQK